MRLPDRSRVLWIDSICIDQYSDTEKNVQVGMMSSIYRSGVQNLVYLGEDPNGMARRALASIESIVQEMYEETEDLRLLDDTLRDAKTGEYRYASQKFQQDTNIDEEALLDLFENPWFNRLWIAQEAFLAKSSSCTMGDIHFELIVVLRTAAWLNYRFNNLPPNLASIYGFQNASTLHKYCEPAFVRPSPRTMTNMLSLGRWLEKSEPRDGVYATLGLLERREPTTRMPKITAESEAELRRDDLLKVDYSRPLGGVLRDATRYALWQSGYLSALEKIFRREDDIGAVINAGIPTWAARPDLVWNRQDGLDFPFFYKAYHEPPSLGCLVDMSHGPEVLALEGFVVDQISRQTSVCENKLWKYYGCFAHWLCEAKDMIEDDHIRRGQSQEASVYEATALSISAEGLMSGNRALVSDVLDLAGWLKSQDLSRTSVIGAEEQHSRNVAELEEISYRLNTGACVARRLFITTSGCIGLGPRPMQVEDLVVVLKGGHTPFILRKAGDDHHLIGQAYVSGIMDGEAVELHRAQGETDTIFKIR